MSTPSRASVLPTACATRVALHRGATLAPCSGARPRPPPERNRHADRHHRPARRPGRRRRAGGRPHAAAQRAHAGDRAPRALRQHAAALAPGAQPLRRRRAGLGVGRPRARRAHRHPSRRADPLDHRARRRGRRLDPRRAPRRPGGGDRQDRRGRARTPATCSRSPTSRPSRPSTAQLPAGAWVLFRTGWGARAQDAEAFLNVGPQGPVTPGPGRRAPRAGWRTEREIVGFGVETVGIDAGAAGGFDPPFPVHHHLLGNGRYGLTQLANLDAAAGDGRDHRRRAAAARRRDRQPGAGARAGRGVTAARPWTAK